MWKINFPSDLVGLKITTTIMMLDCSTLNGSICLDCKLLLYTHLSKCGKSLRGWLISEAALSSSKTTREGNQHPTPLYLKDMSMGRKPKVVFFLQTHLSPSQLKFQLELFLQKSPNLSTLQLQWCNPCI